MTGLGLLLWAALPAQAGDKVIPSTPCRGLWMVPVSFGESADQTLHMVLDTGAWGTRVDPDGAARVLGRRVGRRKTARLRDGTAGALRIHEVTVQLHDLDHLSRALGTPVDGILGFDVFADLLLTLDYPAREVRVGAGALPPVDGASIFRDHGTERPFLALDIGSETVPVLVDSGSTGGLKLMDTDTPRWATAPVPTGASVHYDDVRLERTGRLDTDVPLGPRVLARPIAEITHDAPRLIGQELLREFVWTFDARNRRIRIVGDTAAPLETPALEGVGVAMRPVAAGFEVVRVFPGSAGADAGLVEGDVVTAVDGVAIAERGCRAVGSASPVWTVERDGVAREVRVAPRVLVP